MEDSQIVELFFSRDQQAITESEMKYGGYCRSVARNILADIRDMEEAVNETWLGVWNSIPPARPNALAAFLGRITRNISMNIVRSQTAQKRKYGYAESYSELEELFGSSDVEAELNAKELGEFINGFVEELSDEQRRIFVCRYWYFDSIDDICKRFGYGRGKVKSMLFRIRKRLKMRLEEEELL